jgi:trans-2,3-dihydro-3-hydroxyanthranilate isomerase
MEAVEEVRMRYAFWTVDVFTDRAFGGNPLAVLPDARGLSTSQMQAIAREFNLSETTFVLPPESKDHTFRLRIFTPKVELPFAGHPTVGSAFVLAACGRVPLEDDAARIVFGEGVGPVPVNIRGVGGRPRFSQLCAARLPEWGPAPPPSETLAAMLSLESSDVLDDARDEPQAISCGVPFLFVPLASIEAVRRARVNWEWWDQTRHSVWAEAVFLFSHQTEHAESTVHARMFAPALGVDEDPATGSAAAAFAGYLARREKLTAGSARWRIEQGLEMDRPSFMEVEADATDGHLTAVRVGGQSVIISEGHIDVP